RGRVYLYREHIRPGRDIVSYASEIASMCRDEKIDYLVLSHECFNRRGTINTQADLFRNVLAKRGVQVTPSDKDAAGRLTLLREYLRTQPLRPHEVTEEFDYHYWLERMQTEGRRASDELAHLQSLLNNQVLPKLQVFRSCQEFIHLVPLLVVDKQKKNVLASGQDDHIYDACFQQDTEIETEFGPRKIIDVKVGDRVWTRKGLRKVLWSGCTGERTTINKFDFNATANHPVWTENRGFIPFDSLSYADIIKVCKPSNTTESFGNYGPESVTMPAGFTAYRKDFMSTRGKSIMGLAQKVATSIIRMAIRSTIGLKIWNSLTNLNITRCTHWQTSKNYEKISRRRKQSHLSGTPLPKAVNGTGSTQKRSGEGHPEKEGISSAYNVARNSRLGTMAPLSSAPTNVMPSIGATLAWTMNRASAALAEKSSKSINIVKSDIAHEAAAGRSIIRAAPVYNLEVEGEHEYYANGILVHNCGYALKSYMGHVTQPTRDVYDCILEGRVPQTPMQADFAWREAQRIAGNSDEEALPVSWPIHHRVPK
ncbi:MAG: Hint domain-containing protein, partial [Patescibacteria group bacterium]|nr:Hint domain-containing protein [Patescibacteria group bacterium]